MFKTMTQKEVEKKIDEIRSMAGNTIFSVWFIKKDETLRKMVCRLNVQKNLKGVGMRYVPKDYGLLNVFDMQKDGYRNVNIRTIRHLNIKGKQLVSRWQRFINYIIDKRR